VELVKKRVGHVLAHALPEWRVFVRFPGGRGRYFTITHRHQLVALGILAGLGVWAAGSNLMLMRQPAEIASRVQELESQIAALKAEEARLAATHQVVAELAREVHDVHTNLEVLADTNAQLAKDREQNGKTLPPAKLQAAQDPLLDQPTGPHESASVATVREDLRGLRDSLDRLRQTYVAALNETAALADQSAGAVQRTLGRLGIDGEAIANHLNRGRGRGGPFIPLTESSLAATSDDKTLANLLSRLDHWNDLKTAAATLPLAEPLHGGWDVNSPFGARHDPVNEHAGVHEGLDMGAPYGTPVYATGAGRVTLAESYDRYGLSVDIDHGNGFTTRYAHLSQIKVQVGQRVTRATVVGLLGASGRVTGPHLHYEVRMDDNPQNPLNFITAGRDASTSR
jgi:murein DD-endopeptidase MepM/ murein hydrolase activator NlpD